MTNNINHNRITNHHHHHSPSTTTTTTNRSSSSTITTTSSRSTSTTQACAACRYQRRKCAPDCILAPYFPHDRHRQFQNAHKLFGVSNITKLIRDLDPVQKDEAMRTIIYQADVRAHDPVGGCYRIIRELHRQIELSRAELEIVLHQLAFCRVNNQNPSQNQMQMFHHLDHILIDGVDYDQGLDLDLGQMPQQQQEQEEQYIQIFNDGDDGCEDNDRAAVPLQEISSWGDMKRSPPAVDECQDFKPIMMVEVPAGDQRHEFKFEFDDINESSEALAKEETVTLFTKEENVTFQHHNEDHDLKGAATLFTLTNCSSY